MAVGTKDALRSVSSRTVKDLFFLKKKRTLKSRVSFFSFDFRINRVSLAFVNFASERRLGRKASG